eukprot:1132028-Lingulodinium_polyedra.AAC.1
MLSEDLKRRRPGVCSHVAEHLANVEALLHAALVTGFSFGVPKIQMHRHAVMMLGEMVGRQAERPAWS